MKKRTVASGTAPRVAASFFLLLAARLWGRDSTWEYAVRANAAVQVSPPKITLTWAQDTVGPPLSYAVSRKALTDTSWGSATTLPGSTTTFVDTSVSVGTTYEYQIHKTSSGYDGYGYLYSGINVPLVESR